MFLKKCRCGKSQKNFKIDIGPFFINECCRDAGYNVHGEKKEAPKSEPKMEKIAEEVVEGTKSMADAIKEAVAPKKSNRKSKKSKKVE